MPPSRDVSRMDDGALVRQVLIGEQGAFDTIYQRFFPRLVRLCEQRVRDRSAAEDLAQETMIRALHNLAVFDTSRLMWPWLKTIASHLCINYVQSASRQVPVGSPDEATWDVPQASLEDRDLLARALANVPRRQRIALGLRFFDQWDIPEAAAFLGLDRNSFDQLLFRARRRLQTEYRKLVDGLRSLLPVPGLRWLRDRLRRVTDRVHGVIRPSSGAAEVLGEGSSLASSVLAVAATGFATAAVLVGATVLGGYTLGSSSDSDRPSSVAAPGTDAPNGFQGSGTSSDALGLSPEVNSEPRERIELPGGSTIQSGEDARRQGSQPGADRVESPPVREPTEEDCECVGAGTNAREWLKNRAKEQGERLGHWARGPKRS